MFDFFKDYWRVLLEGSILGALIGTWACFNYAGWSLRQTVKSFAVIVIGILILYFTK